jgi:hypothetical protein
MGGGPGFTGGTPGTQPSSPQDGDSVVEPRAFEKLFILTINLKLTDHPEIYERFRDFLSNEAVSLRNATVLVAHRSHLHDLAGLLKAYVDQKKQFPRGTADRPLDKRSLEWAPNQRISWMAELLPLMEGSAYQRLELDPKKSWNEGANLTAAVTAVPHFLSVDDPPGSYPPASWRSEMPGVRAEVAATHFVGVAGLGLDAAGFQPGDPAVLKKLGVFGYDRETKLTDITDGPDRTIAVIQVPPTYRTSWLAGGGSTVRGVDETAGIEPFVCTSYKGEPGTFVIMADAKVRFLKASTPKETFLALCTIAGGEAVDDLENIAPEVKSNTATLRPRLPAGGKVPPLEQKPPAEAPKKDQGGSGGLPRETKFNDLKKIALAYHNPYSAAGRGPNKVEELAPFFENAKDLTERLKDGTYVFAWGADIKKMTNGTSNTVLAYEAEAPSKGGVVAMADGSVRAMTAQEFNAAAKPGR